ncbi:DNA adenine methylase [Actinomyces gaoshouyii]|uniref:DNA adenine methylase n=1 Tax=Actinomyces gaoshouyii TaxID=1960083 RepID=UPI0009C0B5E0|nr:DNA adenine methylase [Actinomyces gaoshouyii]ARD42453.1 hypothetical protein B6G06_08990 [Actinomyces gaoshouyii]
MRGPRWLSPLRYPGGKALLGEHLATAFWALPEPIEVWIEPFAGGAGAALEALVRHDVPEAWLTDLNPALAAFWKQTLTDGTSFADRVERTRPSLDGFYTARKTVADALAGTGAEDEAELALATLVVNRCSRSGMLTPTVGPIGGKAQAGPWTLLSRWNPTGLAERLRLICDLAEAGRLRFDEADGVETIEALAGSGIEDEVFVYADPPYTDVGNRLYAHGMSEEQHSRLATALRACPSPWVASYDASPAVQALYPDQHVVEISMRHTAANNRVGSEYLIAPWAVPLPEPSAP